MALALRILLLAVLYAATAHLALAAAVVDGNAAPLWPPSGLALAALLLLGRGLWPGVFLGELAVELTSGIPLGVSAATAAGNTAETLLGVWLFGRLGGDRALLRMRDVVALVAGPAAVASLVSATVGVGTLVLAGDLGGGEVGATWQTWYLGNAVGVLLVAPVLLGLAAPGGLRLRRRRALEATATFAVLGGLALWVLTTDAGEPYVVFPILALVGMRLGIVPATVANLLVAGVCVWAAHRGGGPFAGTDEESALHASQAYLGVMALTSLSLAATAGELRRSRRDHRDLATQQAALADLATEVAAGQELGRVLDRVAAEAGRVLGLHHGTVVRPAAPGHVVVVATGSADGTPLHAPGTSVALAPGGAVQRALAGEAAALFDERCSPAPTLAPLCQRLAVPIRVHGEVWGVLVGSTDDPGHDLGERHRAALTAFAELAALAVGADRARGQLVELAGTDALTGLANHRTFYSRLEEAFAAALRHRRCAAVVLVDLDGFKAVNDHAGHGAGDRVLCRAADLLRAEVREEDTVARLGGDELGLLLPDTGMAAALAVAERVRSAVATAGLSGHGRVTASMGVALSTGAASAQALVRHADVALYRAKDLGGDAVCAFDPHMAAETPTQRRRRTERTQTFVAVRAMARAIDARDPTTTRHSERVAETATAMARAIGWQPEDVGRLRQAALVHDVGKLGVPDAILFKAARLTSAERVEVERHAALGAEIVAEVLDGEQVAWVRGHHERPDGTGYPDGLPGASLPAGAALLALADAWDAMTAERPYSSPLTASEALDEVLHARGRQFAHFAVEALLEVRRLEPSALWVDGRPRGVASPGR